MNKAELIIELGAKFYEVDEAGMHEGATEAGITVWSIGVFEKTGDVVRKMNLTFYTKGDDIAFWGVSEPNPTPVIPDPTFVERTNTFLASKIVDGTVKFAHIEQTSEITKKALCTGIMSTEAEKKIIASEDAEGVFSIEVIG